MLISVKCVYSLTVCVCLGKGRSLVEFFLFFFCFTDNMCSPYCTLMLHKGINYNQSLTPHIFCSSWDKGKTQNKAAHFRIKANFRGAYGKWGNTSVAWSNTLGHKNPCSGSAQNICSLMLEIIPNGSDADQKCSICKFVILVSNLLWKSTSWP